MFRKNIYLREQDNDRARNKESQLKGSESPSLSSLASAKYKKFSPSNFRKEEPKSFFNFFFAPNKEDEKIFTLDSIEYARSLEKEQKDKTKKNICAVSKFALQKVKSQKCLPWLQDTESQGSIQPSSKRLVFRTKEKSEKSVISKTENNDHQNDRSGILFKTFNPNQIKKALAADLCEQIKKLSDKTKKEVSTIKFRFLSEIDDKIYQEIDHPKLKKVIQDLHETQKNRINEIFSSIKNLFSKYEDFVIKIVEQSRKESAEERNEGKENQKSCNQNSSILEQPSFQMQQQKKLKELMLKEPTTLKNLYSFKLNEQNSTFQTREQDRVIEDLPRKFTARSQNNEFGFSNQNSRVQSQMQHIYYKRKNQNTFDSLSDKQIGTMSNKSLRSYKKLTMRQIKEKTDGFESAMKKIKEMIMSK